MRKILAIAFVVAAALGGFLAKSSTASSPREWPMTALERQSLRGVSGRIGLIQEEIAKISSGDKALAGQILGVCQAVQAVDRDEEELRGEASARCGVAVIASGALWVPR